MASCHIYTANNSADQSLTGGAAKTLIQLVSPSSRFLWIREAAVGFKSITATDVAVLVQLVRQSTAGTASALTPSRDIESQPVALASAQEIFTVEPTSGVVVKEWLITPIGGQLIYQLPLEEYVEMAVSSRLGLICNAPQAQSARGYIKFNE